MATGKKYSGGFTRQTFEQTKQKASVMSLKVADIDENKDNSKLFNFDEKEMELLKKEIQAHGLKNPILVYRKGSRYEVISGHRRLRAFKALGKTEIPAIVEDMPNEVEKRRTLVTSNTLNRTLNPMDICRVLEYHEKTLRLEHEGEGRINYLKLLAEEFGMSESTVQRYRRLNGLIPALQSLVEADTIPWRSASSVGQMDEATQKKILEDVNKVLPNTEEQTLTALQMDMIIRRYTGKTTTKKEEKEDTAEDIEVKTPSRSQSKVPEVTEKKPLTATEKVAQFSLEADQFTEGFAQIKRIKKISADDKKVLSERIRELKRELKELEDLLKTL